MASSTKGSVKKGQTSIKHSCNLAEAKRKLSKISDNHVHVEYAYAFHRHNNSKQRETKLSQILSRERLVSAVDLLWDRSDFVNSLKEEKVSKFEVLDDDQKAKSPLSLTSPQDSVKLLRVAEKICVFDPYNQMYKHSFFSLFNQRNGANPIRWETEQLFSWMEQVVPTLIRYHRREVSEDCSFSPVSSCDCVSSTSGAEDDSTLVEPRSSLLASVSESSSIDTTICSDAKFLFSLYKDRCAKNKGVDMISSKCNTDCYNPHRNSLSIVENKELLKDSKDQEAEVCSSSTYVFGKQQHAFAGAMAGVSVSLCLHPLDTVKTMIQSCRLEEKSLCHTGRSIISERGFSGLYRGIASNIASSAPISALYTFTYESVKGALLPLFPKEYCSLTHCVAGGSASIATSFIFTPSERIKQQMQVSSHYRNCWTALLGIIQKGGLLSLYAGWTAVLCRNIPHSIIKFYVYENMKQMLLPSLGPRGQLAQPTTLQTLTCGGLAGSAAAFFTTPFDVVKTRLQTQIPGSRNQHASVYQTLQSIRKQEGLRGLYRGLIPRLVMYMSQGAIFFASYEFYKSLLSLEPAQPTAFCGTKQKIEIALNR